MHRRDFIAISAASAAASTVSGMPGLARFSGTPRIAKPELVELRASEEQPGRALVARALPISIATEPIRNPQITLTPLACAQTRIADTSGVDIELRHPGCGIDSIMYSAHNHGLGAFPSGISSPIDADTAGGLSLTITQRVGGDEQRHQIHISASRPGSYLLAIPTEPGARAPIWRTSTIELDSTHTPTQVRSLFESRARSCMLMGVRISENNTQSEGANHAG
ncbi:MAG: hypothetical protein ACF8MF_12085 [Phycisphaerales bacterium JB052]